MFHTSNKTDHFSSNTSNMRFETDASSNLFYSPERNVCIGAASAECGEGLEIKYC